MSEEALFAAIDRSDAPAALALIPSLSKFDARDRYGDTALHLACNNHLYTVVEALLQAGAPVNIHDYHGMSALMCAIRTDRIKIVRMLINAGADLESADTDGWTALHWACKVPYGSNSAKLLLQAWCCPNPRTDRYLLTPLHIAVASGSIDAVALLLDAAPMCALDTNISGWNALHYAAYHGEISCMEAIYAGCRVIDTITSDGETALQLAESRGHTEAAKLLRAWAAVPRRLAFLAGSCLNPAGQPTPSLLASLPIDILRLIIKKV